MTEDQKRKRCTCSCHSCCVSLDESCPDCEEEHEDQDGTDG